MNFKQKSPFFVAIIAYFAIAACLYGLTPQTPNSTSYASHSLNLPIYFEKNLGQAQAEVAFFTRQPGAIFFFSPKEMGIILNPFSNKEEKHTSLLKMQFLDPSDNCTLIGLGEKEYKCNYFIGNEPEKWISEIPNYTNVCYRELYQGISAIFYANHQQLEYDICVAPGENPQKVRFHFEGAENLEIDSNGDLHISAAYGAEVIMRKPMIYQMENENKIPIEGEFVLLAKHEVGFSIGNYDNTRPLVIDPVLKYSTFLGEDVLFFKIQATVDSKGNTYLTGTTGSANFPTTENAYQTFFKGRSDVFLSKMNPTGTELVYSTYLGGSLSDSGSAIAIDDKGSAYVTGSTNSTDFPVTSRAFQKMLRGNSNAFITKFNPSGTKLVFSTYLGGSRRDGGLGIAVDKNENIYVTGQTSSNNFPIKNAFQPNLDGSTNAFCTKLKHSGSALIYSTYLGGSDFDEGTAIAIDKLGHAYVTGTTSSSNFPTTDRAFQKRLYPGATNAFVSKFSKSGAKLIYSTYLGGNVLEIANSITLDSAGHAYLTGVTFSNNFPVSNKAYQIHLRGNSNAFITKLNLDGSSLVYSTYLGGNSDDEGFGICIDEKGDAYVAGQTTSHDFPTTGGAFQRTLRGFANAFITKINPSGSRLKYSSYLGGTERDTGFSVGLDRKGNVYVAGITYSLDFPITPRAFQRAFIEPPSTFITKLAINSKICKRKN